MCLDLGPSNPFGVRLFLPHYTYRFLYHSLSYSASFDKMLFNKHNLALLSATTLLIPSALAADYTILTPCGSGAGSQPHAIVPDATCQKISNTGAFSIMNLGTFDRGVKLGFSATADCKATYTPSREDLAKLQQSQSCQVYVVSGSDTKKLLKEGHGPAQDMSVHPGAYETHEDKDAEPQQQQQKQQQDAGKVDKREDKGYGLQDFYRFIRKRDSGSKKLADQLGASYVPASGSGGSSAQALSDAGQGSNGVSGGQGSASGQTALAYVMLVQA